MALRVLFAGVYRPAEQAAALLEQVEPVVEVEPEPDDEEATIKSAEEA